MKAITVQAPIAWAILNACITKIRRFQCVEPGTEVAIQVAKFMTKTDCENLFKKLALNPPPRVQLFFGQVIGVVEVVRCEQHETTASWDWDLTNPRHIARFRHSGQPCIFEIPDDLIDFDLSKNPILEESGRKTVGSPKGDWRVTVWAHPKVADHYAYSVALAGGVLGDGIPGYPTLHGCYEHPETALHKGIEEVRR
ncbi:hypothetical protein [Aulosira sp. FACHB-615]|uniref:hypothetical protein n=1 Tax=Aulosira sp. FACHB-615 TaxID=2692777 RepID=UPI001686652D|nr:hypothetical protein [Aulosira sp. FACHB-615]MBD2488990.1 hypothetical protein [Aulosira sp. FACHB-615]